MPHPSAASTAKTQPDAAFSPAPHQLLLAFALLLTALVYLATLRFNFVYDDLPQIVNNAAVHSWRFAPGYFTQHVWSHMYPGAPGNYYRPLFLLWLLANFSLFGLHAFGWHLTTLLAHLGATAMVFWLARRLAADANVAAMAALLFGVHPAHIETVAWVSGVTEPLLTLLFIPAFVFYPNSEDLNGREHLNGRERPGRRVQWLAASLAFYALALLSKETAIVLPALIFAYEWLRDAASDGPTQQKWLRATVATLPYAAVSILYLLVRQRVLQGLLHPDATVGVREVLLTWPSLIWLYLKHLVLPAGLSLFYDTPYVLHPGLADFLLPLVACAVVAAALVYWSWKSKPAAMASLLLALPLLPPLAGIGAFGYTDLAHDRYLYLPSIGFAILVAMLLARIRIPRLERFGTLAGPVAAAVILALLLGAATAAQSIRWANNLLLYHYGVQTAPHSALARIHLGSEMMARGDIPSALRLYREARDLSPELWAPNFVLGFADFQVGRYPEAEHFLREAIRITPFNGNQYLYLGLTLMHLGRLDEAEAAVRQGLAVAPQAIAGFHYALGMVLQKKGQLAAARDEFKAELQVDPNSGARSNLAEVEKELAGKGR